MTTIDRLAIKYALKRPTPDRFSLSRENVRNINFFTPKIRRVGEDPIDLIVENVSSGSLSGRQWDGREYSQKRSIRDADLVSSSIEITHHFREIRIRYSGALDFFLGVMSLKAHRASLAERLAQSAFNARVKFRHERIEVLKELVELYIRDSEQNELTIVLGEGHTAWEIFPRIYGQRAFGHPSLTAEMTRFQLILSSLDRSGDLENNGGRYILSPSALETIANFEVQERRHTDQVRHNWLIFLLTLLIAGSAVWGVFG